MFIYYRDQKTRMNIFSFHGFLLAVSFNCLVTYAASTLSVNNILNTIIPIIRKHQKNQRPIEKKGIDFNLSMELLFNSSPCECFSMIKAIDDLTINEVLLWFLDGRYTGDSFNFSTDKNFLFSNFLEDASQLACSLFDRSFRSKGSKEDNFKAIEILVQIVKKNIPKARQSMIIQNHLEKKIQEVQNNLKSWKYAMNYFSRTDSPLNSFDAKSFSKLFQTILKLSQLPKYSSAMEESFFVFRLSVSQILYLKLKGLFGAPIQNYPALICFFYYSSGFTDSDYKKTFHFFKDYQKDEKTHLSDALQTVTHELSFVLNYYKSSLGLENNSYSASSIIRIAKSWGDEKKNLLPPNIWRKLKCMAILETRIKMTSKI